MSEQDRIGGLEQQIEELKTQLADVRQRLLNAELDQWRGRIDDLEVQARLGRDVGPGHRVIPVVEQFRDQWLDTREHAGEGVDTATDVTGRLRGAWRAPSPNCARR